MSDKPLNIKDDDESISYEDLSKKLEVVSDSQKKRFNSLILKEGDDLIEDMEKRKLRTNEKKIPYIRYICKNSSEYYDEDLLRSFELDEILKIYFKIKESKTPIWKKMLRFIFNS